MKNYFIYCHSDPITLEPFYFGIGTEQKSKKLTGKYCRAYTCKGRNFLWNQKVREIGNILVSIVFYSTDREKCLDVEKFLVSVYGKVIDSTGTLVNIEDGGRVRKCNFNERPNVVSCYNCNGEIVKSFKNAIHAADYTSTKNVRSIYGACKYLYRKVDNFYWRKGCVNKINITLKSMSHKAKSVIKLENSNILNIYPSLHIAAKEEGLDISTISKFCSKTRRDSRGYSWEYYSS